MAKDYLPDSYLRKRQRDAKLRRVSDIAAIVLIIAAALTGGYYLYKSVILPKRQAAVVTEEMAQKRKELNEQQKDKIPSSSPTSSNNGIESSSTELGSTDLSSLNYTSSFPLINVSVETGTSGDSRKTTEQASEGEKKKQEEKTNIENPETKETPTQQQTKKTVESNSNTRESNNTKPESNEEKKPEKPENKITENKTNSTGSGDVIYKVYAGSHYSQEAAEQQVKDLAAIGLNGTIIEAKPNFNVYIGSFSSYEEAQALRDRLKASGFSAFASMTKEK